MTQHDPAASTQLSLTYLGSNRFRVRMTMLVDFHGYIGGDENPEMSIVADTEIEYTRLIIPNKLFPKSTIPQFIPEVAAEFVELSAYNAPEYDRDQFILRPKW